MTAVSLALGVVARWKAPAPTPKTLTFQCQYFSMKLGVRQLLSEIGLESFTSLIPGDAEAVMVEGVAEHACSVTRRLTFMMSHVDNRCHLILIFSTIICTPQWLIVCITSRIQKLSTNG